MNTIHYLNTRNNFKTPIPTGLMFIDCLDLNAGHIKNVQSLKNTIMTKYLYIHFIGTFA